MRWVALGVGLLLVACATPRAKVPAIESVAAHCGVARSGPVDFKEPLDGAEIDRRYGCLRQGMAEGVGPGNIDRAVSDTYQLMLGYEAALYHLVAEKRLNPLQAKGRMDRLGQVFAKVVFGSDRSSEQPWSNAPMLEAVNAEPALAQGPTGIHCAAAGLLVDCAPNPI